VRHTPTSFLPAHGSIRLAALIIFFLTGCAGTARSQAEIGEHLLLQVREQSVHDGLAPQSERALGSFYRDLSWLETSKTSQVRILQIGDSHTANDFLSGRLRKLFQERFGNAGRGMMPPGVVYKGIRQEGVKPSQDDGWVIENSLKEPDGGPYGISGFVARSTKSAAKMELNAVSPADNFDGISVDYLLHPSGGKFKILADGKVLATLSTTGATGQAKHFAMHTPSSTHTLSVVALHRDITLTAWGTSRGERGTLLASHGVVSATAGLFRHWDPAIVASDITHLKPSLIIVAYGTNEGFAPDFNQAAYAQTFAELLTTLRHLAPTASILVVGPPDAARSDPPCHDSRAGCHWHRPAALGKVRAIQQSAAKAASADFWDWSAIMQGGVSSWVEGGLGRSDHVHMTIPGYEASADQLFRRLMAGYEDAMRKRLKQPQL
jgi:lysophospholipase L1-like esterase